MLEILGCKLVGGGACPEQYDVSFMGKQLGYFRLRWGHFRADYPDYSGETVYSTNVGDEWCGIFPSDECRDHELTLAVQALLDRLTQDLRPAYIPEDEGI